MPTAEATVAEVVKTIEVKADEKGLGKGEPNVMEVSKSKGETRLFAVKVKRGADGKMLLTAQSSKGWEKWLSNAKPKKTRPEVFGNIQPKEMKDGKEVQPEWGFYWEELPKFAGMTKPIDGAEQPMFYQDRGEAGNKWKMNLAVFRLEGVSDGITLEINDLVPAEEIEDAVKDSLVYMKKLYNAYIRPCFVSVNMTVRRWG